MDTYLSFRKEYQSALEAQAAGSEGRARVCARRAAGLLIQKYFEKININPIRMNCLSLISHLQQTSNSSELVSLISHYSEVVNSDHHLDSDFDLVKNLTILAQLLDIDIKEMD